MSSSVLFYFAEELFVAMLSSIDAGKEYTCTIQREQRPDAVEFAREYLKDHESERELSYRRSNICTFKGALRSSYVG